MLPVHSGILGHTISCHVLGAVECSSQNSVLPEIGASPAFPAWLQSFWTRWPQLRAEPGALCLPLTLCTSRPVPDRIQWTVEGWAQLSWDLMIIKSTGTKRAVVRPVLWFSSALLAATCVGTMGSLCRNVITPVSVLVYPK